jgi:hypothetical protein
VEFALRDQSLGKQFKAASAAGAAHMVLLPAVLGEGAAPPETATLRRLADGHEELVRLDEFLANA